MHFLHGVIRHGRPILIVLMGLLPQTGLSDPGQHRDILLQGEYAGSIEGEKNPKKLGVFR